MTTQRDITVEVFKANGIGFNHNAFLAFWDDGYRIIAIRDEHININDLLLLADKLKEKTRIRKQGAWGCGIALNGEPIYETFIWGFVGDDYIGSGYDIDHITELSNRHVFKG